MDVHESDPFGEDQTGGERVRGLVCSRGTAQENVK